MSRINYSIEHTYEGLDYDAFEIESRGHFAYLLDFGSSVTLEYERDGSSRYIDLEEPTIAELEEAIEMWLDAIDAHELSIDVDELAEYIELVEEAAMTELAAFGCIELETALSDAEWNEGDCEPFWAFACDLYDEPKSYVLTDLY